MDYEKFEVRRNRYYLDNMANRLLELFGSYCSDTGSGPQMKGAIFCRMLENFRQNIQKHLR